MTELRHDPSLELRLDSSRPPASSSSSPFGFDPPVQGTSLDDPSGALRAQEAHDAGAVEPVVELPVHSVWLEFRVHASELEANELAQAVAGRLSGHPLVAPPVAVTVTRRGS